MHRSRPLNADEIDQGCAPFLLPTENVSDSLLYEVRSAYVSPYGVVFKNGLAVKQSFLHAGDSVIRQSATFYRKLAAGNITMREFNRFDDRFVQNTDVVMLLHFFQ